MFPFFALFLIFVLIVKIISHRNTDSLQSQKDFFWEQETAANAVRRKDISSLPYLIIPYDTLPLNHSSVEELTLLEEKIKSFQGKQLLNLTSYTNTQLKQLYGAANLPTLSQCDDNCQDFLCLLNSYALLLIEYNFLEDAIVILELAVSFQTDIKTSYISLARLYAQKGQTSKIQDLKALVENLKSPNKNRILHALSDY